VAAGLTTFVVNYCSFVQSKGKFNTPDNLTPTNHQGRGTVEEWFEKREPTAFPEVRLPGIAVSDSTLNFARMPSSLPSRNFFATFATTSLANNEPTTKQSSSTTT
jgi:hypothetical protein